MCGRFTLTIEISELQRILNLGEFTEDIPPRYNIAPSQSIAAIKDPNTKNIELMRWGLIPSWAKDTKIGYRMINARSESIHEKPSFRHAFRKQRCLIPADGFYEWKKDEAKGKAASIPYYFTCLEHKPFFFAGIWDRWLMKPDEELFSCSIITCSANELVSPIHDRMPVMLNAEESWNWLAFDDSNQLKAMLKPFPADKMTAHPVSRMVNSPSNDHEGLIKASTYH